MFESLEHTQSCVGFDDADVGGNTYYLRVVEVRQSAFDGVGIKNGVGIKAHEIFALNVIHDGVVHGRGFTLVGLSNENNARPGVLIVLDIFFYYSRGLIGRTVVYYNDLEMRVRAGAH
jgi:hypothetical protein